MKGQFVTINAQFVRLLKTVGHAPSSYRNGKWVRIVIVEESGGTNVFTNVMVPKDKSNICFELNRRDIIKIYAQATIWMLSGGNKQTALIVSKIDKR